VISLVTTYRQESEKINKIGLKINIGFAGRSKYSYKDDFKRTYKL
jgi:hypothetical protein